MSFVGTIGNLLCIWMLTARSQLKYLNATQYLIALACSDVVFLLANLPQPLIYVFRFEWDSVPGLCTAHLVRVVFEMNETAGRNDFLTL